MSSEGEIRTCFISARLPSWAGVRQGVAGTNVNGGVVGAPAQNGVLAYSRLVPPQQQQAAAAASVFRPVFPSVELSLEVTMMRQAMTELQRQLQELRAMVEMQLQGASGGEPEATEGEEEEEEEIVVDVQEEPEVEVQAAPSAVASTMEEEEEDEMVLTLTVVEGPEPAGVGAPPPTPESDPAVSAAAAEATPRGDN